MNNKVIKPFKETLYTDGIEGIAVDFSEIALDDLTTMVFSNLAEPLMDLPLVKWAVDLGKFAWSAARAFSIKKQLAFMQQMKKGDINPKAVERRKKAIQNREKWIEREIETSVIYLERYESVRKAVYQARIYRDLINEIINFDKYEEYLAILDQMFVSDIPCLLDVVAMYVDNSGDFLNPDKSDSMKEHFDIVRCNRLQSLGLLDGIVATRVGSSEVERYVPTDRALYFNGIL